MTTRTAAVVVLSLLAALAAGLGPAQAAPGGARGSSAVTVVLAEWTLVPSATTVRAGKVTFQVTNDGAIEHEFVVLRTDSHHHALTVKKAVAVETGRQGEIAKIVPGEERSLTLNLKPGKYVLICNLLGHYKAGQYAALRVR